MDKVAKGMVRGKFCTVHRHLLSIKTANHVAGIEGLDYLMLWNIIHNGRSHTPGRDISRERLFRYW